MQKWMLAGSLFCLFSFGLDRGLLRGAASDPAAHFVRPPCSSNSPSKNGVESNGGSKRHPLTESRPERQTKRQKKFKNYLLGIFLIASFLNWIKQFDPLKL